MVSLSKAYIQKKEGETKARIAGMEKAYYRARTFTTRARIADACYEASSRMARLRTEHARFEKLMAMSDDELVLKNSKERRAKGSEDSPGPEVVLRANFRYRIFSSSPEVTYEHFPAGGTGTAGESPTDRLVRELGKIEPIRLSPGYCGGPAWFGGYSFVSQGNVSPGVALVDIRRGDKAKTVQVPIGKDVTVEGPDGEEIPLRLERPAVITPGVSGALKLLLGDKMLDPDAKPEWIYPPTKEKKDK